MNKRRKTEAQKALLNKAEADERLIDNLAQIKLLETLLAHGRASIKYLAVCCSRSVRTIANYISQLKALGYLAANPRYAMRKIAGRQRWLRETNQWTVSLIEKLTGVAEWVAAVARNTAPAAAKKVDRFVDKAAVHVVARSANAEPETWAAALKEKYMQPVEISAALLKTTLYKRR